MDGVPESDDLRRSATHVLLEDADTLLHDVIVVGDDVEHHLRRVLRLRDGESVSVTDGAGRWRMCVLRDASSGSLEATSSVVAAGAPAGFTLASAIPKGDRVDWMVQKATELGADRVMLLHAERSSVRWKPDRSAKQLLRLQRIADEALRQSRRVWRCTIVGPVAAMDVLADATIAEPGGEAIRGDEAMVAIGPEGGWSDVEAETAGRRVSIGANILRTETAAVAATTLRMVGHH
ncbi:MAG: RsmE family RNA methyltransferase [Ilumatobacter sp.]|uniref:RsmE family RNA methyltransferase n=1 Tax=Ilumatobacter sp. TaxID=1967498 RepID=UPI00329A6DA3